MDRPREDSGRLRDPVQPAVLCLRAAAAAGGDRRGPEGGDRAHHGDARRAIGVSRPSDLLPAEYGTWLAQLKARIQGARQRAALAANAEQIQLYHELGREILVRQEREGWGAKVIERLSADLREAFPDMK